MATAHIKWPPLWPSCYIELTGNVCSTPGLISMVWTLCLCFKALFRQTKSLTPKRLFVSTHSMYARGRAENYKNGGRPERLCWRCYTKTCTQHVRVGIVTVTCYNGSWCSVCWESPSCLNIASVRRVVFLMWRECYEWKISIYQINVIFVAAFLCQSLLCR